MRKCWEISIRWSDIDRQQGLFTDSAFCTTQEDAIRGVAESMAQSAPDLDPNDNAAIDRFVERAVERVESVTDTSAQLPFDIGNVFCDELFPDGCRRDIDMNALAALLSEHRDSVLKRAA